MTNQLKFDNHVAHIQGKIEKANSILKYVSSVTKDPEINTALMLYESLVRSVSDYGCFVYAPLSKMSGKTGKRTIFGTENGTGIS